MSPGLMVPRSIRHFQTFLIFYLQPPSHPILAVFYWKTNPLPPSSQPQLVTLLLYKRGLTWWGGFSEETATGLGRRRRRRRTFFFGTLLSSFPTLISAKFVHNSNATPSLFSWFTTPSLRCWLSSLWYTPYRPWSVIVLYLALRRDGCYSINAIRKFYVALCTWHWW